MAGRTRLYQQAKSPLIQGQSKYDRPGWQPWLGATLLGWLGSFAVIGAWRWWREFSQLQPPPTIDRLVPVALGTAVVTLVFSAIGAAVAVWLSGQMGWRRPALGSALVAMAFGIVLGYPFVMFVLSRWAMFG